MNQLQPEKCFSCSKFVRTGHPFIICKNCDSILHKKCKTKSNIIHFRDSTYCVNCTEKYDIIRYNPFYQPPHFTNNDVLDSDPVDYIESIKFMSDILENCQSFSINHLNSQKILPTNESNYFSTCFLNIDGNSTNFDYFTVQLSSIQHKFSVIGLAETNTDPTNGNLYQINEYSSLYQSRYFDMSKNECKTKGSGVCLYIHNSLNYNKDNQLSLCKNSIETLFITITNTPEPLTIGVIYRPPNSSIDEFNEEYNHILSELNGKKAHILGDYNINLFNSTSPHEDKFQEIVFSNGFAPTISIPTHQMPHCIKTCIDNIYSNDVDPTAQSGVIKDKISHHNIVYFVKRLSDSTTSDQKSSQEKITIHYNYSNSNLDKLCAEIEDDMETLMYSCDTFEAFTNLFQQ